MNCSAKFPVSLLLSYWGGEDKRSFQVVVEDNWVAFQELYRNKPEELFDVLYEIPGNLTQDKKNIKVTLKGNSSSRVGGLFYAYTFSEKDLTGIESVEVNNFPFEVYVENSIINLFSKGMINGIISLYASNGHLLYKEVVNNKREISISQNLSAGVYTIQFISEHEHSMYTKKIIV